MQIEMWLNVVVCEIKYSRINWLKSLRYPCNLEKENPRHFFMNQVIDNNRDYCYENTNVNSHMNKKERILNS